MKLLHILLLGLLSLTASQGRAEPDRLVRAMLGISSIPARFPPPEEGTEACYLTFAKFKNGNFIDYGSSGIAHFWQNRAANTPAFEAELGWGKKEGAFGYIMTTQGWSTTFRPDDFFRHLSSTRFLAKGRKPTASLGEFQVLGYAVGGEPLDVASSDDDTLEAIKHNEYVVVFLMKTFASAAEAEAFGASLTPLSFE